jgi:hypothetical protein
MQPRRMSAPKENCGALGDAYGTVVGVSMASPHLRINLGGKVPTRKEILDMSISKRANTKSFDWFIFDNLNLT